MYVSGEYHEVCCDSSHKHCLHTQSDHTTGDFLLVSGQTPLEYIKATQELGDHISASEALE